jgi:ribosomal protein S18 acetylase RimI-like enzyme
MSSESDIDIRPLRRVDAAAYRALRLEALERHPDAFGSSFEDESPLPLEHFAARIPETPPAVTFAAWAGQQCVGMAGFYVHGARKARHRGVLWGMYVRSAWRGSGVGEALVRVVIDHARFHADQLELTVAEGNRAAAALYERLGFTPYGVLEDALRIGDRSVAEVFMVRRL